MGCTCGRKSSTPIRPTLRPSIGPRPLIGGSSAGVSPAQIRALGLQQSISLGQSRRLDEQRLAMEKLRRDAIKKKLNK